MTKDELQAAVDAVPFWYHRVELPHGIVTPGWAPLDASAYRIPDDLSGKRVLDVGAWDGYWTFEAVRRGALFVEAIDDFSDSLGEGINADRSQAWRTFDLCRDALGCRDSVLRTECSLYDSAYLSLTRHDVIFCFGVLYHLQHPLLALQNLRKICTGTIHIETAILDGCQSAYSERGYTSDDCCFEFYPHDEYGLNGSNWYVGTLRAWCGLVEAAGFENIEAWKLTDNPQHVSRARGFIRASV